jgi:hypothetical protein
MYPFYLGLDLHNRKTYAVLMGRNGELVYEREFPNEETATYLEKFVPYETYAVLEATRNYDLLKEHVERVELAHPKELKAISTAAVKTDQIDAKVLAHLARLHRCPGSSVSKPETATSNIQNEQNRASLEVGFAMEKNVLNPKKGRNLLTSAFLDVLSYFLIFYTTSVLPEEQKTLVASNISSPVAFQDIGFSINVKIEPYAVEIADAFISSKNHPTTDLEFRPSATGDNSAPR